MITKVANDFMVKLAISKNWFLGKPLKNVAKALEEKKNSEAANLFRGKKHSGELKDVKLDISKPENEIREDINKIMSDKNARFDFTNGADDVIENAVGKGVPDAAKSTQASSSAPVGKTRKWSKPLIAAGATAGVGIPAAGIYAYKRSKKKS